tara:strand:- start:15743 stop:16168 length:426 start_codon:yes stop_codon:yes gene_type:complete
MKNKKIALSGGFDPVHVGHVRMIQSAADVGDVVIIANSDDWLQRKKGYIFMPWSERAEILSAFKGVVAVIQGKDDDDSVCESIADLKNTMDIDYFGNGGDRKNNNTPEVALCDQLGIELVWNLGGQKIQSSSELVERQKDL